MTSKDTDKIARVAARLYSEGTASSLKEAIHMAAHDLGLEKISWPGVGRVRQHIQAQAMQTLGDEGYKKAVEDYLGIAQEIMALLEASFDDMTTLLSGRAAKGFCDGGATLHIRMYTKQPIGLIAERLVEHGCEEPRFQTAETKFGRLDRMSLSDRGVEIVLTRCGPALLKHAGDDLFTGRRIETLDLESLCRQLGE